MTTDPNSTGRQGEQAMPRSAFPAKVVAVVSVITVAVLSVLCWQMWHAYQNLRDGLDQDMRLEEIRGQMNYVEEAQTTALWMAAVTGEERWERRYRGLEPVKHAIVEEARRIAPRVFEQPAAFAAAEVKVQKEDIEDEGLERIRQGELEAAQALLAQPEYNELIELRRSLLDEVVESLGQRNLANARRHRRNLRLETVVMFIALPAVGVMWMGIAGLARRRFRQRDRAEQQLREGLAFYTSVTESMHQGMFVLDRDFRYRMWNAAMERMFGMSRSELVGTNLRPWDVFKYVEAEGVDAMMRAAMAGQAAERYGIRRTLPDGTVMYTAETYLPVRGDGGPPGGVLAIIRDVTETHRTAKALRESERLFRTTFEQAGVGMAHVASDGRFLKVNRSFADMLWYAPEALVTRRLEEVVHPDDLASVLAGETRLMAGEAEGWSMEMRCIRADGSEVPVLATASLLRDESGRPEYFVDIVQDITERKQAEREREKLQSQVRHAQKLESLGLLAGGIAHDFNNLLVGILGNADLALTDASPESPVRPALEAVKRAAIRASELTNQMLAYSGKGRLVAEKLDLSRLVEDTASLLEASMPKNVKLHLDLAESLPPVEADAAQIRQVVMNLITNASEAIGAADGVVRVATGVMDADRAYLDQAHAVEEIPEGRYVYAEIADTGCGMDEQTLSRLFDPFFSTKFAGRGLGLAAALGIVRGHHGAIRVRSTPGEGSTFRILLPPANVAEEAPSAPVAESAETWRGHGTALVIDDEEGVRNVAGGMFQRLGFEVLTAADGQEGVEAFRRDPGRVRVILLDLTMPHLGGEATLREIRRIRPDVKVILSSGYPEEAAARQFAGMGLSGFIQKPFAMDELAGKLRTALAE